MCRYSKFAPNSPMVMNGQLPTEADRGTVRFLSFTRNLSTPLQLFDNICCRQPWRLF